ncbi:hypothetical protein SAMN04489844_0628 [Nocardioides exalbidus]|uniref:HEAT repeat-containing protein n=1 Tax=Nocardioides exalbidus TaxID=402596 RepID=A0A1H4KLZ7_9ACTN|nr:hypothetical protein [Nocardioides exalbidus]SEB59507.1 hypothetical protein SAMN04489844_0628 [Nocardioides exalbidus]
MNRYEEPDQASPLLLAAAIEADDPDLIISRLIALALQGAEPEWLTGRSIELGSHPSAQVRRASVVALGHIARVHRSIDADVVVAHLQAMASDPDLAGAAADALEDIEMFTGDVHDRGTNG